MVHAKITLMIGRPRIAASVRTLKVGRDGIEDAFDANDIVFYQLPEPIEDDKTLITDITTQYRRRILRDRILRKAAKFIQAKFLQGTLRRA